jgi:hypothetical protein
MPKGYGKRRLLRPLCAAAALALGGPAVAQSQSASGRADLVIDEFLFSISTDDGITSFGNVAFSDAEQTVTVDPANPERGRQPQNFNVRGPEGESFDLRFTDGTLRRLGNRNSTQTLTMTNFTTDPPGPYQTFSGDDTTIRVGGDLVIPGGSPIGRYIGTYRVTVVTQ